MGMEGLSSKTLQRNLCVFAQQLRLGPKPRAIHRVAEQGMAKPRQMHANLMRPAGLQPAFHEARDWLFSRKSLQRLPMGDRLAAPGTHRHLVAGLRMAVD